MSLSIDIVIVVRNKSCMMQCLVGDTLVQSRVERERDHLGYNPSLATC